MRNPKIRFKGYADTWEQRKLSDVYLNIGNAFVGTATPYYVENGHFYLESNNVKDGQINHNTEIFINDEFYEKQKDKWLHTGDMVMVQSGHVGHAAVIPEELDNTAAHALIMFRNPKMQIEPYFLNYQYQTLKVKKKIDNITTGNTIKHILASDMQEFIVDIASYDEQKKIARYFQNLDNLITLHQRKCEEIKTLKKFMLQKMFPQNGENVPEIRFDGFTNAWEQRKLEDVVEFLDTMRKPLEGAKRTPGPYPYYGASGIVDYVDGYLFDEELVLLSEDGANITDRNYPVCFLASGKYWVNNHAHVLRTKDGNENNFICNSLERKDYKQYNSGMAMPKLNQEVCRSIPISCPSFDEQKKIGDYFRNLDNLITLHQRKCDELQSIKKFMLQNMFV